MYVFFMMFCVELDLETCCYLTTKFHNVSKLLIVPGFEDFATFQRLELLLSFFLQKLPGCFLAIKKH